MYKGQYDSLVVSFDVCGQKQRANTTPSIDSAAPSNPKVARQQHQFALEWLKLTENGVNVAQQCSPMVFKGLNMEV